MRGGGGARRPDIADDSWHCAIGLQVCGRGFARRLLPGGFARPVRSRASREPRFHLEFAEMERRHR
eukprot:5038437-Lingulodinium_polyedra.AAC.1